jgi:hypothetical protein
MIDVAPPQSTFRGLPLAPGQDAEVRHYIKRKKQHGAPWGTPELADMLEPPATKTEDSAPPSTKPWNPLRPARSGMRPWKPKS